MDLNDERGVVLGWLVKLVVFLSVLGLVLFELGAITVNYFGLDTSADDIAVAVSTVAQAGTSSEAQLQEEARIRAKDVGAKLVDLKLNEQQQTLKIVLTRKASTLLLHQIDPIKGWGKATVTAESGTQ